jgi:hypothetical protein
MSDTPVPEVDRVALCRRRLRRATRGFFQQQSLSSRLGRSAMGTPDFCIARARLPKMTQKQVVMQEQ